MRFGRLLLVVAPAVILVASACKPSALEEAHKALQTSTPYYHCSSRIDRSGWQPHPANLPAAEAHIESSDFQAAASACKYLAAQMGSRGPQNYAPQMWGYSIADVLADPARAQVVLACWGTNDKEGIKILVTVMGGPKEYATQFCEGVATNLKTQTTLFS
jgi:hypothetical protein